MKIRHDVRRDTDIDVPIASLLGPNGEVAQEGVDNRPSMLNSYVPFDYCESYSPTQ